MILMKITCELKFSERIGLLSAYEEIHNDILRKQPDHPERWLVPGLKMEEKEKRRAWLIDPMRCAIDIEDSDVNFCKSSIIDFFNSVNTRIGIPSISRYGLRSTWIKEFRGSLRPYPIILSTCLDWVIAQTDFQ